MGFLYQLPAIVGGTVLVIERIESQNFQPGVFGWAIYANGDAEFNNVLTRGSLIAGPVPGRHVEINTPGHLGEIALFSGNGAEVNPIVIGAVAAVPGTLEISADSFIQLTTPQVAFGVAPNRIVTDGFSIYPEGVGWIAGVLTGTWVDVAGARFGYTKDATGRVQVRGKVSGGGAGATIFTLPAGYRPSSNLDFSMRSGTTLCAVGVSTGGVLTVTANLATATVSGINLDVISFPTL
jgi:hypothetical protein